MSIEAVSHQESIFYPHQACVGTMGLPLSQIKCTGEELAKFIELCESEQHILTPRQKVWCFQGCFHYVHTFLMTAHLADEIVNLAESYYMISIFERQSDRRTN